MATVSLRTRLVFAAVLLLSTALLPACYTIFAHPRLAEFNYRRPDDPRCGMCHSGAQLWDLTHPPTIPPMSDPWGDFYETPWWFERSWRPNARSQSTADSAAAVKGGP